MGIETKQLRLSVVLVDSATEHIKKLRGEMENLSGGVVSLGLGKVGQQAEGLTKQFVPLIGGFGGGASLVKTVTDVLPMLGRSLGGIGIVATAVIGNFERYRRSLADYGTAARELNIAAASLKKVEQEWRRAGMTDPQMEANRSAIAQAMGDAQNQASQLARSLKSMMHFGSETQRNAVEKLMESLRTGAYEDAANAIKNTGDVLYNETLELTNSATRAQETKNRFFRIIGVEGFNLPIREIVKATKEEIEDLNKQIEQWGKFGAELRRATVAVENINWQLGLMNKKYGPVIAAWKSFAEGIKTTTGGLKRGREFRERQESGPTARDRLREKRDRARARVQKQSYSGGNGAFGGAPIVLASYQDSTEKIRDDVRETVILTDHFRTLNNALRMAGGGGGASAIRASLGMPPGGGYGGGRGYGPSGTGTRGTGGGTTGPSTTQPSVPPSIPGMPGVRPGDTGVAAMIRSGTPRANLLASLQPTTPGGERPLAAPSMDVGAAGGVAGMIGTGAVGGTGSVPAGAGPRTDAPSLKMSGLPRGMPYGGGGQPAGPSEPPGGEQAPGQWNIRGDIPKSEGSAAIRYKNPGAHEKSGKNTKWGTTGYGFLDDNKGGHTIQKYPTWSQGIAANIDQIARSKHYKGKPISAAISTWSGGGRSSIPGYDPNEVITEKHLTDPNFLRAWFVGETPLTKNIKDADFNSGIEMYKAGSLAAYNKDKGISTSGGKTGVPAQIQEAYGSTEAAVDDMMTMLGKEEGKPADRKALIEYINSGGHQTSSIVGREKAWCAWIVNAALTRQGIKNPGSGAAGSYARKGVAQEIEPRDARKGDIFLVPGSGGAEGGIAHTGLVTGPMNKDGTVPTISGNTGQNISDGGMVGLRDYSASKIRIRRLPVQLKDNATSTQSASKLPGAENAQKSFSFAEQARRPGKPFVDPKGIDRALGGEVKPKVEGDGDIEVDVKGPNGTKVTAKGGGIFKRASVNRVKEPIEKKEAPAREEPKVERTASRTDEE